MWFGIGHNQELRAVNGIEHPNWTGNVTDGNDFGIYVLPEEVDALHVALPASDFRVRGNEAVLTFRFKPSFEYAVQTVIPYQVLHNSTVKNPSMFRVDSSSATMDKGRFN